MEGLFFGSAGCVLRDTIDVESQSFSVWVNVDQVTCGEDSGIHRYCGSRGADDSTVWADLKTRSISTRAPEAANSDMK